MKRADLVMKEEKKILVSYGPYLNKPSAIQGHYEFYQLELIKYAITTGLKPVVLAGQEYPATTKHTYPILPTTDFEMNTIQISNFLSSLQCDKILFHIYEGHLADLQPLSVLAEQFPQITFHLNLLRPDL